MSRSFRTARLQWKNKMLQSVRAQFPDASNADSTENSKLNYEKSRVRAKLKLISLTFAIGMFVLVCFTRMCMHYMIVQKAAFDATAFLSTVPKAELMNKTRGADAAAIAGSIATLEMEEFKGSNMYNVQVDVHCDNGACGLTVPTLVSVTVRLHLFKEIFSDSKKSDRGLFLAGNATMPYLGK